MTNRYFFQIEYDGTLFHGFQRQQNTRSTVQEKLEMALLELTQEHLTVTCAGRTDTGVHALGQVVHVDLEDIWSVERLQAGLNFYLKNSGISVLKVYHCDLHARFDAKERFYEYQILNRSAPSPLLANRAWHMSRPLDIELMSEACHALIGYHNFDAFRSSSCAAPNPMRTLKTATISHGHLTGFPGVTVSCSQSLETVSTGIQNADLDPGSAACGLVREATPFVGQGIITLNFSAQAFLHNQVRIMVGTLVQIGLKKLDLGCIGKALQSGSRKDAGVTAPPHGLYFVKVVY
ncbi:MAG: tRNA pseudouridine synthase A [Pseudomonadota bacterium]